MSVTIFMIAMCIPNLGVCRGVGHDTYADLATCERTIKTLGLSQRFAGSDHPPTYGCVKQTVPAWEPAR